MLLLRRAQALAAALLLVATGPAAAQDFSTAAASAAEHAKAAPSPAEECVRGILSEKGVHVVRLWAPWCHNSTREMARSWDRLLKDNSDASFTFVTVWNNGRGGGGTLKRYGLLERVTEVVPAKPDRGRLNTFLGYAVDWMPSTWVFRTEEAGEPPERAFALNYGEIDRATVQTLIDAARADW